MKKHTYKSSGVNIAQADAFIKAIQSSVKSTQSNAVISRKGSFGGLYALDSKNVLVSSTDGVGTKLLIAQPKLYYMLQTRPYFGWRRALWFSTQYYVS